MWWDRIKEYFGCDKYKKLYEEEKQKYQDLKRWTEGLVLSNQDFFKHIKEINLQSK